MPCGLYLLAHLRLRHARWFGNVPRRHILSVAGHKWRIGACLQLNLNHQFTASVTYDLPFGKGKQFGTIGTGRSTRSWATGKWTSSSESHPDFPLFVVDSANASGVDFSWNGNSLNRPNQVGDPNGCGPVACESRSASPQSGSYTSELVQSLRVCISPSRRTWKRQPCSGLRAAICKHGPLVHQAFPAALREHAPGFPR